MRYDINFNPMPNKAHLVVLSEAHLAVLRSFLKKLIATCDFSIRKISKKTVYAVDDDTVSFSHSLVYNETRSDELKAIVFEIVANSHSQTEIIGFLGRGRYGKVKACIGRIVYTRLDLKIEMHNSQSSDRSVLKVQQQRDERWKERVTEEYAFTQQIYSSVRMLYNFAGNKAYFILPYLGFSFDSIAPTLNLVECIWLASKAIEAMIALHRQGILHNDLHLGNILFHEAHKVSICDFNKASKWGWVTFLGLGSRVAPEGIASFETDAYSLAAELGILFGANVYVNKDKKYKELDTLNERIKYCQDKSFDFRNIKSDRYISAQVRQKIIDNFANVTDPEIKKRASINNLKSALDEALNGYFENIISDDNDLCRHVWLFRVLSDSFERFIRSKVTILQSEIKKLNVPLQCESEYEKKLRLDSLRYCQETLAKCKNILKDQDKTQASALNPSLSLA